MFSHCVSKRHGRKQLHILWFARVKHATQAWDSGRVPRIINRMYGGRLPLGASRIFCTDYVKTLEPVWIVVSLDEICPLVSQFSDSCLNLYRRCVISDFRHEVNEICVFLGYYAASNGNFVPTFLDDLSVPSSRVKNFEFLTFEDGAR